MKSQLKTRPAGLAASSVFCYCRLFNIIPAVVTIHLPDDDVSLMLGPSSPNSPSPRRFRRPIKPAQGFCYTDCPCVEARIHWTSCQLCSGWIEPNPLPDPRVRYFALHGLLFSGRRLTLAPLFIGTLLQVFRFSAIMKASCPDSSSGKSNL